MQSQDGTFVGVEHQSQTDLDQTLNKSFADGMQFAWDATSLKLAEECPRKYYYTMIERWYSPKRSIHLEFGGIYATALEHFYKLKFSGMSIEDALESVVLEALIASWHDGKWYPEETLKTRENLIRTIVWYVDEFRNEEMKVITLSDGRPAIEHSFSLEVDDGYMFCGHLDRIVEWGHNPYVMDQKTTKSTISSYYFDGYNPDIQMSMYTFAGKMIFHLPVKGVIIDAAQIAVGFTRFMRGPTFRSQGQLNEWYDDMLLLIENTRRMTKENHFPMNTSSCGNYGGCLFRPICSRDPSVRENFLKADFVQGRVWDPLERR